MWLLSLAVSAVPVAILGSIYARSRGNASPEATGIVLLLCGIAFLEAFSIRASVLGWAGLAAFVFFLERRDGWYYLALPIAVLWANLHASVVIAPLIVLVRVAGAVGDGGFRGLRTSRDFYILPAVLLATFCTPLGWRLPIFAVALTLSPIRHFIIEWLPPRLSDFSFTLGALPLVVIIAAAGRAALSRHKDQVFSAALLFAAALFAQRNIPFFAIVAGPLAAGALDLRVPQVRQLGPWARELAPVALIAIGIAIPLTAFGLTRVVHEEPSPIAAVASLAGDRAAHRLLCEDFAWCSLALEYPNVRVFLDGRFDGYPLSVWRQYDSARTVGISWREPLRAYGVDAIVARRGSRLAVALLGEADWRITFQDRGFVVFRRE
jgi:hypothetical protein